MWTHLLRPCRAAPEVEVPADQLDLLDQTGQQLLLEASRRRLDPFPRLSVSLTLLPALVHPLRLAVAALLLAATGQQVVQDALNRLLAAGDLPVHGVLLLHAAPLLRLALHQVGRVPVLPPLLLHAATPLPLPPRIPAATAAASLRQENVKS
jgi:hypothetical protein